MNEKLRFESSSDSSWDSLSDIDSTSNDNTTNLASEDKNDETNSEKINRTRETLLSTAENFARNEHKSYDYLSEELAKSGVVFSRNNNPIEYYGELSAKIDSNRINSLVEYIDAISADDPDNVSLANDRRNEYLKATKARGEALFDTASNIQGYIIYTGNESFDNIAKNLETIKQNIPEGQYELARAYFAYFDNPKEQTKRALNTQVNEYIESFKRGLDSLFNEVNGVVNSRDLPDSEYNLRQHLSLGYEDIHKLIMDYYEQKSQSTKQEGIQTEHPTNQEPSTTSSSEELPIDVIV